MYKLLIADDEMIIRKGLSSLKWEENGMEIIGIAKNGIEAQELIDSQEFDLLITDIKMPGITGLELAENLYRMDSTAKTVLLTGYGEFEYAQQAIRLGVFEYIMKPSSPEQILDCAIRACREIEKERRNNKHLQQLETKVSGYEQLVGSKVITEEGDNINTDIKEILTYIYAHYQDNLTLSILAQQFHFSSVYLSCYIKKYTGHTFLEILTAVRMYHAAELLRSTKLKNADIGSRIGIADERYFGQVFKKKFGKTPYEYRKEQVMEHISLDDFIMKKDGVV